MSNLKSILGLLAFAGVLVAAHLAVSHVKPDAGRMVNGGLLCAPDRPVRRLAFTRPALPSLVVASDAAGSWRLTEPVSAPADAQALQRVLDALAACTVEDPISDVELLRIGRTRSDFGLDAPRLRLTLGSEEASGGEILSFGAFTPSAEGVYAAKEGAPFVFTVPSDFFSAVDLGPADLRCRSLFRMPDAHVTSVEIRKPQGGSMTFVREGGRWIGSVTQISETKVSALVSSLLSARLESFVGSEGETNGTPHVAAAVLPRYGLDAEDSVRVTLSGRAGETETVVFGKRTPEGAAYVLVEGGSSVAIVSGALAARVAARPEDFTDTRLFPVEAAAVESFSLTADETSYVIARDGDGWRLDAPIAAPADATTAGQILARILALTTDDTRSAGISVGVSTQAGTVCVDAARALGASKLTDLRTREILRVAPQDVQRLVVRHGDDTNAVEAVVYNASRNAWDIEHATRTGAVDEEAVTAILSTLAPLMAESIVQLKVKAADAPRFGLETPTLTLSVDLAGDGTVRRNILVGLACKGKGRYATLGASDAVFILSERNFRTLARPLVEP